MPTITESLISELARQIEANPANRLKPGTAGEIESWLNRHIHNGWVGSPVTWRDPANEATIIFDETGSKPGGIADYIAAQREVRPYLFIEDDQTPTASAPTVTRRSDLGTPAERAKWIGLHGLKAWEALKP